MTREDNNNKITLFAQENFKKIDSTNNWAKTHPERWAKEGVTLITASEQTGGRGRFKRRWESPPGVNIYATYCFWVREDCYTIGYIPQLLALAAAQTLEKEGLTPHIKWPNDVLVGQKKIAGILCETIAKEDKRGVVCGIGLNVNMPLEALQQIDRPATSFFVEMGRQGDISKILEGMTIKFIAFLDEFFRAGFTPFFPEILARSPFKRGDPIRFHDNLNKVEGQFEALHPDGSVELLLADGTKKKFYAGEFLQ